MKTLIIHMLFLLAIIQSAVSSETEQYLKTVEESRRLPPKQIIYLSKLLKKEQAEFSRLFLKTTVTKFHKRLLIAALLKDEAVEKPSALIIEVMEQLSLEDKDTLELLSNGLKGVFHRSLKKKIFNIISKDNKKEILFRNVLILNSDKDIFLFYLNLWRGKKLSNKIIKEVLPALSVMATIELIEKMLNSNNSQQVELAEMCIAGNRELSSQLELRKNNPQLSKKVINISKEEKASADKKLKEIVALFKTLKDMKGDDLLNHQEKIFKKYLIGVDIDGRLFGQLELNNPLEKEMYLLCHFRVEPVLSKRYFKILEKLHDSDQKIRSSAILSLKEANDDKLLFAFYRLLDDPFAQVREDALDSIYLLAEDKEAFIPKLNRETEVLNKITYMLKDRDVDVIIGAIQLLVAIRHSAAYDAIVKLAYHENKSVKISVCDAIAQRSMKTATDELRMLLQNRLWEIRARAARVYWEMGIKTDEEVELLLTALKKEKDDYVKSEIIKSLRKSENPKIIDYWREQTRKKDAAYEDYKQLVQTTLLIEDLAFLKPKLIGTREGLGLWLNACGRLKYKECLKELEKAFQDRNQHLIALNVMIKIGLYKKEMVLKAFNNSDENNEVKASYFSYFLKDGTIEWSEKQKLFDRTIKLIDVKNYGSEYEELIKNLVFDLTGNKNNYSLNEPINIKKKDYYNYFQTFKKHSDINVRRIFWRYQFKIKKTENHAVIKDLITIQKEDYVDGKIKDFSKNTIGDLLYNVDKSVFENAQDELVELLKANVVSSYRIDAVKKILPENVFSSVVDELYVKAEKDKKLLYFSFKLEGMTWKAIFKELKNLKAQKYKFKDYTFKEKLTKHLKSITPKELQTLFEIRKKYGIAFSQWSLGNIGRKWPEANLKFIYKKIKSNPTEAGFYWFFIQESVPIKDSELLLILLKNVPPKDLDWNFEKWAKKNQVKFIEWFTKEKISPELQKVVSKFYFLRSNAEVQSKLRKQLYKMPSESQAKIIGSYLNSGTVDEKLFKLYVTLLENKSTRTTVGVLQVSFKNLLPKFSKKFQDDFKIKKMKLIKYRLDSLKSRRRNQSYYIKPVINDLNLKELTILYKTSDMVKKFLSGQSIGKYVNDKIRSASSIELAAFLLDLPEEDFLPKNNLSKAFYKLSPESLVKIKKKFTELKGNQKIFVLAVIFDKLSVKEIINEVPFIAGINRGNPFFSILKQSLLYSENKKIVSCFLGEGSSTLNNDVIKIFVNYEIKVPVDLRASVFDYIKSSKPKYGSEAITFLLNQENATNDQLLTWVLENIKTKPIDSKFYYAYYDTGEFLPLKIGVKKSETKKKNVLTAQQLAMLKALPENMREMYTISEDGGLIAKRSLGRHHGSTRSLISRGIKKSTLRIIKPSERALIDQIVAIKKKYFLQLEKEKRLTYFVRYLHLLNESELNSEVVSLYGSKISEDMQLKIKKAKVKFLVEKTPDELLAYFKTINLGQLRSMRSYFLKLSGRLSLEKKKVLNQKFLKSDTNVRNILIVLNSGEMNQANFIFWLDVMDQSLKRPSLPKNHKAFYQKNKDYISKEVLSYFKKGFGRKALSNYLMTMGVDNSVYDFLPEVVQKLSIEKQAMFLLPFYAYVNKKPVYLKLHLNILKEAKFTAKKNKNYWRYQLPPPFRLGFSNIINLKKDAEAYPFIKKVVEKMGERLLKMTVNYQQSYIYQFNGLPFEMKKNILNKILKEKNLNTNFIEMIQNANHKQAEPYLKYFIIDLKKTSDDWQINNYLNQKHFVYPWMPENMKKKYQKKPKNLIKAIGDFFK